MTWSYTKDQVGHAGNMKIASGTFSNTSSSTGGAVLTGLATVNSFVATTKLAGTIFVDETFPLNNVDGAVTVTTTTGVIGTWIATGV
jgi:hypothetical protein